MPRRLAFSDLRSRCLQQADLDTDAAFSGSASATTLVNAMMAAQHAELVTVVADTGLRYFESSFNYVTTGSASVSEPTDHLATVDTIERIVDATTGRLRRLRQLAPQERSAWSGRTGHARRWELVDDQIILYPTPPAGDTYVLRYIPQPPDLTTFGDTAVIDVVSPDGESFMIWGCVVRFLARVKSDVTLALHERDEARKRLSEWAGNRAFNASPRRMVEIDDGDYFDNPDYDGWYDR